MPFKTLVALMVLSMNHVAASEPPLYKPSSRAAEPIDIRSNAYGGSSLAPDAMSIGEIAPDFRLPISGGDEYVLSDAVKDGPVAIIFYRGHW